MRRVQLMWSSLAYRALSLHPLQKKATQPQNAENNLCKQLVGETDKDAV